MLIKRRSPITGVVTTKDIATTQEEIDRWLKGELIQDAMPQLSNDEREFIKTGLTKDDWNTIFGEEE